MGAGGGFDAFYHSASYGINNVPVALFEGRHVNDFAVGREGEAIATARVRFFPENLFGFEVERGEGASSRDVKAFRGSVGGDAFDVEGFSIFVESREGNAFHEFVAVIDVEDDDAVAAVFEVVANAGCGDVQKAFFGGVDLEKRHE